MGALHQHWIEEALILDILSPNEANLFVKKYLPSAQDKLIVKLVEVLHNFPLALTQAVGYIKQHTNIDHYLKLYSSKKKEYLDILPMHSDQYKKTLWKTVSVTLDKLGRRSKEMLYLSSYLAPDNISLDLFDDLSIEDRANAIQELRNHSLIILTRHREAFRMHRLLQEIIRLKIQNDPVWMNKVIQMATKAVKNIDLNNKDSLGQVKNWLHHVVILKNYMDKNLDTAKLLDDYGKIAVFFGLQNLVHEFYLSALEIKSIHSQESDYFRTNNILDNLKLIEEPLENDHSSPKQLSNILSMPIS